MNNEIDITDIVEQMKETFILSADEYLLAAIVANPSFSWVGLPIVRNLCFAGIKWVLTKLSDWSLMQAFFLNTALRKTDQALKYVEAVKEKNQLSENASQEEYEKLERKEIDAFNSFVRLT